MKMKYERIAKLSLRNLLDNVNKRFCLFVAISCQDKCGPQVCNKKKNNKKTVQLFAQKLHGRTFIDIAVFKR